MMYIEEWLLTGLWVHRGMTKIMRACSDLAADILTQEATYIAQVRYRSGNNIELEICVSKCVTYKLASR
jgi:hypothetical protein